jgi:hypothetical protein
VRSFGTRRVLEWRELGYQALRPTRLVQRQKNNRVYTRVQGFSKGNNSENRRDKLGLGTILSADDFYDAYQLTRSPCAIQAA